MSSCRSTRAAALPASLGDVTVAILAGGLGTRLQSAAPGIQKVMVEVDGRPFLTRWLDRLDDAGFRNIVLCVGHRAGQVASLGARYRRLALHCSFEPEPLGTAGALRAALPRLDSDPVLVLNGDSFCDVDLGEFLDEHLTRASDASLVLTRVENMARFGSVRVGIDGKVEEFVEKQGWNSPGWINAGIYLFSQSILRDLPAAIPSSLERETLPGLVRQGLFAFPWAGRFIDIGTPESLREATRFFEPAAQTHRFPSTARGRTLAVDDFA